MTLLVSPEPVQCPEEMVFSSYALPSTPLDPGEAVDRLYERGSAIVRGGGLVIAGMSLRNPQFTRRELLLNATSALERLVRADCPTAGLYAGASALPKVSPSLFIMLTDGPFAHSLRGIGYPEGKVPGKCGKLGKALRSMTEETLHDTISSFVEWERDVYGSPAFEREIKRLHDLRQNAAPFCRDLFRASSSVLVNLLDLVQGERAGRSIDLREVSNYVLDELAFLIASPEIYGVDRVAYAYHRPWHIAEKLFSGAYDGVERERVGLLLMDYSGVPTGPHLAAPPPSPHGAVQVVHTGSAPAPNALSL